MEKVRAKRRVFTIEEKLTQVDAEIIQKEAELKALKEKRKELFEKKKAKDVDEIYNLITQSGKSMEEIKELLSK